LCALSYGQHMFSHLFRLALGCMISIKDYAYLLSHILLKFWIWDTGSSASIWFIVYIINVWVIALEFENLSENRNYLINCLYFSALDAESERIVQEALDTVSRGEAGLSHLCTCILSERHIMPQKLIFFNSLEKWNLCLIMF
jgi:hypothetical protein